MAKRLNLIFKVRLRLQILLGATTIITGIGSEFVSESNQFFISDWIRRGSLIAALYEVYQRGKACDSSIWSVLYEFGLEPLQSC